MVVGPELKSGNGTILELILEKTGKTRLNRASLRAVPVADLREVCEAVSIVHENLTKPEIISLLLDAGELNVGGGLGAAGAVVKTEPEDFKPAPDNDGARGSILEASGRISGRGLTRKSLKPAKPTRANPRRGTLKTEEVQRPHDADDASEPDRQTHKASNANSPGSHGHDMHTARERKEHATTHADHPDVPTGNMNVNLHRSGDKVIPPDGEAMGTADDCAAVYHGADEQTPAVSTEQEGDDPDALQPRELEVIDGPEQDSPQADMHVQEHGDHSLGVGAVPDHDDSNASGTPAGGQDDVMHDPPDAPTNGRDQSAFHSGGAVDVNGDAAALELMRNARDPAEQDNPERLVELETSYSEDDGNNVTEQNTGTTRTGEPGGYPDDEADEEAATVNSDTKLKRERDDNGRGTEGLRRGMFDHVRASQSVLEALEEDPVEPYSGPRLIVTLVKSSYAISRNKPGPGLPRRTVAARKAPGLFSVSAGLGVPPAEYRGPLISTRSNRLHTEHWNRSAKFTALLSHGEKAEYAKHGHCVSVIVTGVPHEFWYCPALKKRFVIDPMEWDKEYHMGVQRIESSMASNPETWFHSWIRRNICRPARASSIRQFMSHQRMAQKAPKNTYYRHFSNLAKGVQRVAGITGNALHNDVAEQVYERGCARTVGCASGLTFDMLVALPKAVIYDVMVAFGREPCTDVMIQKPGADALLRRLITNFCTPDSFDRVVCKQGQPPKVKLGSSRPSVEAANHPAYAPHRDSSHRASARDPSPDLEHRIIWGRGHVMADDGEHRRKFSDDRPRPSSADEDLRKARKQPAAAPTSRVATKTARDNRDSYGRLAGRPEQGKDSWPSEPRRRPEHVRPTDLPVRRQGPLPSEGRQYKHNNSRIGSMPGCSTLRDPVHRSLSREPGGRACSSSHAAQAHSRDPYDNAPDSHVRAPRDSGLTHEYLPPAPARRGLDAIPGTEVRPAAIEPAALPLMEHAYVTQSRHDAPIAATSLTIPAATIQDHFQAALAKAVQDVVKSMGIVPSVAGGVPGIVPGPMILGAGPSIVQPETYAPPPCRPHVSEPHMHIPPPQGRARSVKPEPVARRTSKPSNACDSDSRMHADARGNEHKSRKRSRLSDEERGDMPQPRPVMPRHTGANSVRDRNNRGPHRERSPPQGPHRHPEDRYPARHSGSSHQKWRQSPPPPPSLPDSRAFSPRRHCAPPSSRDRPPAGSHKHRKDLLTRPRDHGRGDGWYKPGTRQDRDADSRTQQASARLQSISHGRPPQRDGLRQHSSPSNLPLPPPTNTPHSAGSTREPTGPGSSSGGMGRFIRDPSPPVQGGPSTYVDKRPRSHERTPYHNPRNCGETRPPPERVVSQPPPVEQVLSDTPVVKLRSGGSRVADRRRTAANAQPGMADNEDAFAVEYNCFAVGDGLEGKASAQRSAFNSGKFTAELVTQAAGFATSQIQVYVSERGRNLPLMGPVHVLQQASNSVRSTGAAAVLLGMLNPLSGYLSIGKVGDVGYLVLRPPGPDQSSNDLKVMSMWRPYDSKDHTKNFDGSQVTASMDLVGDLNVASWAHDSHSAEIRLQPSDLIIAATDGFFDVVHVFGSKGLATRQYVRELYLENQLDPGQLAEKLLLRAWNQVQSCRSMRPDDIDTPFFTQVKRGDMLGKFRHMPEDDIAVVVSYVLQA